MRNRRLSEIGRYTKQAGESETNELEGQEKERLWDGERMGGRAALVPLSSARPMSGVPAKLR